ncbi:hypothetical protein OM076_28920 [Solirubrobacter ginsenosidimutans]|uniref:DUF5666 domain-containing protein n=1 Tax=Solirubrobacter ginsenosidimutans TaxID=490573 RepID=A0A9X3MZM8_9ACTN|nr:hypothetical protein [Solirubrobacter ginsenosidimutans]MDA0164328.1 hypothetical protein [Solirubrobacter ginsenosidimutans]
MNRRRAILAAAAATLATAAFAPAAHAWTEFSFSSQSGTTALVEVDATAAHNRLEVVRGATLLAQSAGDTVSISDDLHAGDVANLYSGNALVATGTYDGLPKPTNVCIGHTAFSAARAQNATIFDAGAYRPVAGSVEWVAATWTADADAVVTLRRPLVAGDTVYVTTSVTDGTAEVRSSRGEPAIRCWYDPPTDGTPPPPPPPPPTQATIPPSELIPTNAQMLAMVKGSLSVSGSSLKSRTTRRLARSSSVALPFAFPEPGRVDLQLVAKHKVIGTGTKTSAINGKAIITVTLTSAGRKLLKRSKKLKVTVNGIFAASRTGAELSRASLSVTMKG